jgi:hypothetical protein
MKNKNHFSNQEDLWGNILSEDKDDILNLLNSLSRLEIEYVNDHLIKMVTEDGWHPSQQRSAAFALDVIRKNIELE